MAFQITPGEVEYQYGRSLAAVAYKVFLATTGSLTYASSLAAWEAAELPSINGYQAVTGTIAAGSYDETTGIFAGPSISGQFIGSNAGFTYDAMVIKLANRTKPYAINIYDLPRTLAAGQARGFRHTFGVKL